MTEAELQNAIRLAVGQQAPHARLFRNNVGQAWLGREVARTAETVTLLRPLRVVYGLNPGSGDLIGWTSVTVTPDMINQRLAVITSAEVKTATGRITPEQENWRDQVRAAGGFADIIRSPEDALRLVRAL